MFFLDKCMAVCESLPPAYGDRLVAFVGDIEDRVAHSKKMEQGAGPRPISPWTPKAEGRMRVRSVPAALASGRLGPVSIRVYRMMLIRKD
jgi:hypothetical protein